MEADNLLELVTRAGGVGVANGTNLTFDTLGSGQNPQKR
jgi:hypothetical protein